MKYISEFRDQQLAAQLSKRLAQQVEANRHYHFMEFCGGHTHAIYRYGLPSLLPDNITMVHGPGCPVCVLPAERVDYAIALAQSTDVIFCSYADMLRVPGSGQQSLLHAKAAGADVRMIYSVEDALAIAAANPERQVIFFAIGFETTTPPTAVAVLAAKRQGLTNFSVFCNHVLTPIAMRALLELPQPDNAAQQAPVLDGFVGPAHVSIVIGSDAYLSVANDYKKPIVISGFEPLDVLQSISMLVDLSNSQQYGVFNQYRRAVVPAGNQKSQQLMSEVFCLRDQFEWRGLGDIKDSALQLRAEYAEFDAELRFNISVASEGDHRNCQCADVLRGIIKPLECPLFAKACTPEQPLGACMVSSEGACAAYYAYGGKNRKNEIDGL